MAIAEQKLHEKIISMVEEKSYRPLKDLLVDMNPIDLIDTLDDVPERYIPIIFRLLPKDLAAETFVEMDNPLRGRLITELTDTELKEVIDELFMDDAADLIEEMPASVVSRILTQADPEFRQIINELLQYPEGSAGSIMTTEFVSLQVDLTVEDAVKRIRRTGIDKETIDTCYVINSARQLIGVISLRTVILSDFDDLIGDLMRHQVVSVNTLDDQEDVARLFEKYSYTTIPVVDAENRLVGIVTVDDAIDVLMEETSEDIARMAAIVPSQRPYLKDSVYSIWKSRIPWLLFLMFSATFTSMIINHYEGALATYVVLTAFIPMLMDTGGNAGSQSSATIIRGLSLNELEMNDTLRVIWKEIRVAVLCGATMAVANFAKLMWFDHVGLMVALVVCFTLVAVVLIAKLSGCILPILAFQVGLDPAVMAGPIITTIVDALALLMYFYFAKLFLGI